jgi:THO complex subunit 2
MNKEEFFENYQKTGWSEGLTQCQSLTDIIQHVLPYMHVFGPYLSFDVPLMTKLCRIAKSAINFAEPADTMSRVWLKVVTTFLLPSLSMTKCDACLSNEIWQLVKSLPYAFRYTIYGEWKNIAYDTYPELAYPRAEAILDTKKIMRRISKDNVKQFGRQIGKLSHANPAVVFSTIIDQLQVYENLVVLVVDCLRYVSDLSFDVLTYILIESLANPEKERLKPDGTNLSLWLTSKFPRFFENRHRMTYTWWFIFIRYSCLGLAAFSGNLFKKYQNLDMSGLLNYIFRQILDGNPFDLIVLKELVTRLSGVEQLLEGTSDYQVSCLAGGETLRLEVCSCIFF